MIRNIAASGILLVVACLAGCISSADGTRRVTSIEFGAPVKIVIDDRTERNADLTNNFTSGVDFAPLVALWEALFPNEGDAPPEPEAEPAPNP